MKALTSITSRTPTRDIVEAKSAIKLLKNKKSIILNYSYYWTLGEE